MLIIHGYEQAEGCSLTVGDQSYKSKVLSLWHLFSACMIIANACQCFVANAQTLKCSLTSPSVALQ